MNVPQSIEVPNVDMVLTPNLLIDLTYNHSDGGIIWEGHTTPFFVSSKYISDPYYYCGEVFHVNH